MSRLWKNSTGNCAPCPAIAALPTHLTTGGVNRPARGVTPANAPKAAARAADRLGTFIQTGLGLTSGSDTTHGGHHVHDNPAVHRRLTRCQRRHRRRALALP